MRSQRGTLLKRAVMRVKTGRPTADDRSVVTYWYRSAIPPHPSPRTKIETGASECAFSSQQIPGMLIVCLDAKNDARPHLDEGVRECSTEQTVLYSLPIEP